MKRTPPPKPKAPTHFAQIPIATVKKIAEVHAPAKKPGRAYNVTMESSWEKTEPYSMPLFFSPTVGWTRG